jgi:glycosyltransferase involved in cell wall biosynthesis
MFSRSGHFSPAGQGPCTRPAAANRTNDEIPVRSTENAKARRATSTVRTADGSATSLDAAGSVLHLHAPGSIGGAERVVQLLAVAQREAGQDVTVAVVLDANDGAHAFCGPLDAAGVRVVRWQVPRRRYDVEHAHVTALCRQLRPGVVHTHGYRADVVGASAARRLGIPLVSTAHGFTGGGWKNRLFQTVQCRSFRRADAVIAVSRPVARELARRGVPGDRIHVIPNAYGTDGARLEPAAARERLGVPPGGVHVGWVGRVTPEKGLDVMLDALESSGRPADHPLGDRRRPGAA